MRYQATQHRESLTSFDARHKSNVGASSSALSVVLIARPQTPLFPSNSFSLVTALLQARALVETVRVAVPTQAEI